VGGDEAMIVAGLGFRHGVSAEELLRVLEDAALRAALEVREVRKLATLARRSGEPGLVAVALCLALPIDAVDDEELRADTVTTRSARILERYGVGSVCEAAALAAAGPGARLKLARIAGPRTTCALAEGPGR
jgi:cobalt-precorrin 5A hydrolase